MTRLITVGAAQLGPIQKQDSRESAVIRMIALLKEASSKKCDLVVFPELASQPFSPVGL